MAKLELLSICGLAAFGTGAILGAIATAVSHLVGHGVGHALPVFGCMCSIAVGMGVYRRGTPQPGEVHPAA